MQERAAGGPARLGVARYATEKLRVSMLVVGGATWRGPVERGTGARAGPEAGTGLSPREEKNGMDGDVADTSGVSCGRGGRVVRWPEA